ncbi:MAG: hypothetical protein OSJ67_07455 [Clostridia bacterium]|nr:hypothetical protein [Clostridia bacterium]
MIAVGKVSEEQMKRLEIAIRQYVKDSELKSSISDIEICGYIDEIITYCNRDDIPPQMEMTVIAVVADRIKDGGKTVSSISQGDSSISYVTPDITKRLNRWRRIV